MTNSTAFAAENKTFNIPADFSTVIGAQSHFVGDLQADANQDLDLRVDGKLDGSVVMPMGGIIYVDAGGSIAGERIEADYIVVKGDVSGTIISRKALEIAAGSVIKGSIEYHGTLEMQRTSRVNASIHYAGA